MRLLLAVSKSGALASGPDDDMKWTGPMDKAIFRLLTSVDRVCAVGSVTRKTMPAHLDHRDLWTITRAPPQALKKEISLDSVIRWDHNCGNRLWLLGGPTLAYICLAKGVVNEVHLVTNTQGGPDNSPNGPYHLAAIHAHMTEFSEKNKMTTWFGHHRHDCWRKHSFGS